MDPDDLPSDFLQAITALQVGSSAFRGGDNGAAQSPRGGQQYWQGKALDIGNYLNAMYLIASNITLPALRSTYLPMSSLILPNLSDIKLPEIYVMDSFIYSDGIGNRQCILSARVDCGDP